MRVAKNITPETVKKLNRAVILLAQGKSKRYLSNHLHIDRADYRGLFYHSKAATVDYSIKVANWVLKNRPTFAVVKAKFGAQGLRALWDYSVTMERNRYSVFGKQVTKLRSQGISFSKIADKLGRSPISVLMAYRASNPDAPRRNIRFYKAGILAKRMLKMHYEGRSPKEIASKLDRSIQHVQAVLRKYDIKLLPEKMTLSKEDVQRIIRLHNKLTWEEIAHIYNVGSSLLRYHLAHITNEEEAHEIKITKRH